MKCDLINGQIGFLPSFHVYDMVAVQLSSVLRNKNYFTTPS